HSLADDARALSVRGRSGAGSRPGRSLTEHFDSEECPVPWKETGQVQQPIALPSRPNTFWSPLCLILNRGIIRTRPAATCAARSSQIQGQAVPRHLAEACCAVEGECGGLRADHFEIEGAQAAAARFFEHVGEDGTRHARS